MFHHKIYHDIAVLFRHVQASQFYSLKRQLIHIQRLKKQQGQQ